MKLGDMTILIYKESYFRHPLRNVFPGIFQPSYNHLCMKVQVIVSTNFGTVGLVTLHLTFIRKKCANIRNCYICSLRFKKEKFFKERWMYCAMFVVNFEY
jgi:hypothetical protein